MKMTKRLKTRKATAHIPRSLKREYPHLKTVRDAAQEVSVIVTPKDCKESEPLNPSECAMARAVKREFKVDAAVIGIGSSWLIKGDEAVRFETPDSLKREIISFDRNHDFEPGDYYLKPMPPSLRLGMDKRDRRSRPSGKHRGRKHHRSARVRVLGS